MALANAQFCQYFKLIYTCAVERIKRLDCENTVIYFLKSTFLFTQNTLEGYTFTLNLIPVQNMFGSIHFLQNYLVYQTLCLAYNLATDL